VDLVTNYLHETVNRREINFGLDDIDFAQKTTKSQRKNVVAKVTFKT